MNTMIVHVVTGPQVLDNMVACTGLVEPSEKTREEWETRSSSLSEYGSVLDISPPLMMGISAVAIEVCDDLVNQEHQLWAMWHSHIMTGKQSTKPSQTDIANQNGTLWINGAARCNGFGLSTRLTHWAGNSNPRLRLLRHLPERIESWATGGTGISKVGK